MAASLQQGSVELRGASGSPFSRTLQEITTQKLEELTKKRKRFDERKDTLLSKAAQLQDPIEFLKAWSNGVKQCFDVSLDEHGRVLNAVVPSSRLEFDLVNIDRFIEQARYDPSISARICQQWEHSLQRHVDVQSLKYAYARLYGQLTGEMLASRASSSTNRTNADSAGIESEDFQHVTASKKMEARQQWEEQVFQVAPVSSTDIDQLLKTSFEPPGEDSKPLRDALRDLREHIRDEEHEFASVPNFDEESLAWVIQGLLGSDLLTDEQREVLRDFQSNSTILTEVADVLNMWISTPETWTWGQEVVLEERRGVDGGFRVFMNQDLLQAIFLHYVGMRWSIKMKNLLEMGYINQKDVWATAQQIPPVEDRNRREFFLGTTVESDNSVAVERRRLYRERYFLSLLPQDEYDSRNSAEGDEEANFEEASAGVAKRRMMNRAAQTAFASRTAITAQPKPTRTRQTARKQTAQTYHNVDDGDNANNPMDAKQTLLHLLSTEILIKGRFQGEITFLRSQIEDLFPTLPHQTILQTLKFFGFSPRWIQFFQNFLQAPLRFSDGDDEEPRVRQRGTPGSQQLSEMFGEVVLFVLDFQINQATEGEHLWRMHDDFWFWSAKEATCETAWKTITSFSNTMGLRLNMLRTGCHHLRAKKGSSSSGFDALQPSKNLPSGEIRWGMLLLNPETGKFEIDHFMVDKHVQELTRQLKEKAGSVFAWIQAWNTYAATFFTSNFGKPANCFGRKHVDDMLATHERIQRELFSSLTDAITQKDSGSVVEFLKQTIAQRFGITDIPDGYFFFPVELGGLDLQNPFIKLIQIQETVVQNPVTLLDEFEVKERFDYNRARKNYLRGMVTPPSNAADPKFRPQRPGEFMSFEEYTRFREDINTSTPLLNVYRQLLGRPQPVFTPLEANGTVAMALNGLSGRQNLRGILPTWHLMQPYWQWVANLYGQEMVERFGGLSIVDPGLLPIGMVGLFRSGRVKWQE